MGGTQYMLQEQLVDGTSWRELFDVVIDCQGQQTSFLSFRPPFQDKPCANHFEVASKIGCLSNDSYGEDVDYTKSSKDDGISSVDGLLNSNGTVNCGRTVEEAAGEILSNGKPEHGTVTTNVYKSLKSASSVENSAAATPKIHSNARKKFKSVESVRNDELLQMVLMAVRMLILQNLLRQCIIHRKCCYLQEKEHKRLPNDLEYYVISHLSRKKNKDGKIGLVPVNDAVRKKRMTKKQIEERLLLIPHCHGNKLQLKLQDMYELAAVVDRRG